MCSDVYTSNLSFTAVLSLVTLLCKILMRNKTYDVRTPIVTKFMAYAFIVFNIINPEAAGPALPAKQARTPRAQTQHDSGYLHVIPWKRAGKQARRSRLLPPGNF